MERPTCVDCFNLKIVGKDGVVLGVKCAKQVFEDIQKWPIRYKGKGWVRRAESCVYYDNVEYRA